MVCIYLAIMYTFHLHDILDHSLCVGSVKSCALLGLCKTGHFLSSCVLVVLICAFPLPPQLLVTSSKSSTTQRNILPSSWGWAYYFLCLYFTLLFKALPGHVHFASDCWTSPNKKAFVAFIIYFEQEGKSVKFLLDIVELSKVETISSQWLLADICRITQAKTLLTHFLQSWMTMAFLKRYLIL